MGDAEDELLRLACIYAESDRESFIQCHEHMPNDPACKRAVRFLSKLRAYRLKRWGKTALESELDEAKAATVQEVIAGAKEKDCPSCYGLGHFNDEGQASSDRRDRKCTDCSGTGSVPDCC